MSNNSLDWMSLKGKRSPHIESEARSILVSISEITASVSSIKSPAHEHVFIEIGSHFYRLSVVIMELEASEDNILVAYPAEMLQSLSESINFAKDLVEKCNNGAIPGPEMRYTLKQLESTIKWMGEDLDLITSPAGTSGQDKYFFISVQSLMNGMKIVDFETSQIQDQVEKLERDLYTIDAEVPTGNDSKNKTARERRSSMSLTDFPVEPLYESFFCPLTKKVMEDPVTIESGVTYERKAITEWYERFHNSNNIYCPKTGQKIANRVLRTNVALKATIEQWEERNEVATMKASKSALALASTPNMILEALKDLQSICKKRPYNVVQACNLGVVPLLGQMLQHDDEEVKFESLELLRLLAEIDDEGKEVIVKSINISLLIKMVSSKFEPVRHMALLLILELSKSNSLSDEIGAINGGILMLISVKYRQPVDAFASEKADQILKNLEKSVNNIKSMAENGHWEPLLNQLTEGNEEMKLEMASCLGEIVLGHDGKSYVAERASPVLINMVKCGNSLTRNVAFKALKQISFHQQNGHILVKAGVLSIMFEEMFSRTICDEPMNSKAEAASILANILESGIDLNDLQVNTHGHTISSDYILYDIINKVGNSTPDEVNISLLRFLLSLMKFSHSLDAIVSVMKKADLATANLIALVNNPSEEVRILSTKFLITLSPFIGHTLAEKFCKTRGQPWALVHELPITEVTRPTEKHAVSVNLLAKLPHENLTLNLALLDINTVPSTLQRINRIQRLGTRMSRFGSAYLEGLVGILVRFTETLYDYQILLLCQANNFTAVFTELLMNTSSDEVQRLSAVGLENLSSKTVTLSKPPDMKIPKYRKPSFLRSFLSTTHSSKHLEKKPLCLCPIHRGICSSQETFCLVDAKAVDKLLACLEHGNAKVVEAALSAICTLLDERVDTEKSITMLIEENTIQRVLNVVKEHGAEESLQQKCFWLIEKFLTGGGDYSASEISQDRLLPATLISVLHHGDGNNRQMAEKILGHLHKMPNSDAYFTM